MPFRLLAMGLFLF